jgi:hypothetical protein
LLKACEILAKLGNGCIEVRDVAVRACLHHRPFHRRQHELRERASIEIGRQSISSSIEAFENGGSPCIEVRRQRLAHGRVGFVQFEREAADRTTIRSGNPAVGAK